MIVCFVDFGGIVDQTLFNLSFRKNFEYFVRYRKIIIHDNSIKYFQFGFNQISENINSFVFPWHMLLCKTSWISNQHKKHTFRKLNQRKISQVCFQMIPLFLRKKYLFVYQYILTNTAKSA